MDVMAALATKLRPRERVSEDQALLQKLILNSCLAKTSTDQTAHSFTGNWLTNRELRSKKHASKILKNWIPGFSARLVRFSARLVRFSARVFFTFFRFFLKLTMKSDDSS